MMLAVCLRQRGMDGEMSAYHHPPPLICFFHFKENNLTHTHSCTDKSHTITFEHKQTHTLTHTHTHTHTHSQNIHTHSTW